MVRFHELNVGDLFMDGNKLFVKNTHHTAIWKPSPTSFVVGRFNSIDMVKKIEKEA